MTSASADSAPAPATANSSSHASLLAEFVSNSLGEGANLGLSAIPTILGRLFRATACVVWDVSDPTRLNVRTSPTKLFSLAAWYQDDGGVQAQQILDLGGSATGQAICNDAALTLSRLDTQLYPSELGSSQRWPISVCAAPLYFNDGTPGAVSLYREEPFSPADRELIGQCAALIPKLTVTMLERNGLAIIHEVNGVLHDAEVKAAHARYVPGTVPSAVTDVARLLAKRFECVESTIFLEDRLSNPGVYELAATTWPSEIHTPIPKREPGDGLTGWVLANGDPVYIPDLRSFAESREDIRRVYPGITWRQSLASLQRPVREALGLLPNEECPPLSFIAAPILDGDVVRGVARCSVALSRPYFFARREAELLVLVCAQLGRFWSNWITRAEMQTENDSWRSLVNGVAELNGLAYSEFSTPGMDEKRVMLQALQVASTVVPGAEILDVRLVREEHGHKEMFFAETYGDAWHRGTEYEIQWRRDRTFPLEGPDTDSAGAHVYSTGQPLVITDVHEAASYSPTFPETRAMILVPVMVKDEVQGVLDIRTTSEAPFPEYAPAVAQIVGSQLGLYRHLAESIAQLRTAKTTLQHNIRAQAQAFQDLEHQLASPLLQASARAEKMIADYSNPSIAARLQALRGLCRKANRVAMAAGAFAQLARQEPLRLHLERLSSADLVRLAIESATDAQLLTEPRRGIRFDVYRETLRHLQSRTLVVDVPLFEQCLASLLDNASKYSYPRSRVVIYGEALSNDRFGISVRNSGIELREADIPRCVARNWRSQEAQWTTGEGSGIGLWIVDNVVRAHGGRLKITPTKRDGTTVVEMVLPTMSPGSGRS